MIKMAAWIWVFVGLLSHTARAESSKEPDNSHEACAQIELIGQKSKSTISELKGLSRKNNTDIRVRQHCREFKRDMNRITLYAHSDLKIFAEDQCQENYWNDTPKKFAIESLKDFKFNYSELCL
jgi:hypothetical protein